MFNQNRDMDLWRPPWKLICDGIIPEGHAEGNFEHKLFEKIIKEKIQVKQIRAQNKSQANRSAEATPKAGTLLANFKKPALKVRAAVRLAPERKAYIPISSIKMDRELDSNDCNHSASSFISDIASSARNV